MVILDCDVGRFAPVFFLKESSSVFLMVVGIVVKKMVVGICRCSVFMLALRGLAALTCETCFSAKIFNRYVGCDV